MVLGTKKSQHAPTGRVDVYISAESIITGDLKTKSNVKLDGQVNGNIETSGNVHIGKASKVNGSILAKNVQVAGAVNGDIAAEGEIILFSSANLTGNINAVGVTIEKGALYKGTTNICAELRQAETKADGRKTSPVLVRRAEQ